MSGFNRMNNQPFNMKGLDQFSSIDEYKSRASELLKDYNFKLIDNGLSIKCADLRKKDLIDIRDIMAYPEHPQEPMNKSNCMPVIKDIRSLIATMDQSWYSFIPCFNEGVLRVNSMRYIYWQINKIDVDDRTIDITLYDYMRMTNFWQRGIKARILYDFNNQILPWKYKYAILESQSFPEIYRMLSKEELHWSDRDMKVWNDLIVDYAVRSDAEMVNKGESNADSLSKYFSNLIVVANYELWLNKPKAIREKKAEEKQQHVKRTAVADEVDSQPKKLTRVVGGIKMQSAKVPRFPTKESVVHYKTAVWKARGGVRRMKDGRLIPFKESVRHRKCLQKDNDVPANHLILKGTVIKEKEKE